MKFVFPEINHVFESGIEKVPILVIENPGLLYELLSDIRGQLEGNDGKSVVSDNGKILSINKSVDLLTDFIPFTINRKNLLAKASAYLEKTIIEGELYAESLEVLGLIESFLTKAAFQLNGDISFTKVNLSAVIKAAGLEFREEYESLAEKIIDYFELVSEYEGNKLFIVYNLRSLISDSDAASFLETVLIHEYNVLMIENTEHMRLPGEERYIIDKSLCEIG